MTSPTSGITAGWYADPQGQPQNRYWDGTGWTTHTQPLPPPAALGWTPTPPETSFVPSMAVQPTMAYRTPEIAPKARYNPYRPDADRAAGKNTPARNGLILGIICLFVNPVFLIGAGAIVWASVGIGRANRWARAGGEPTGRTQAAWGLALGILGSLGTLIVKGGLF